MRAIGVLSFFCLIRGLSYVARFRRWVLVGAGSVVCVLGALYWIGVSVPPPAPSSNENAPVRDTFVSRIERPLTDPKIIQGILSKLEMTLVQPLGHPRGPGLPAGVSVRGSQGRTSNPNPNADPISNPGPLPPSPPHTIRPLSQAPAPANGQGTIDPNDAPTVRGAPSQMTLGGPGPDSPPIVRGTAPLRTSTSGPAKAGTAPQT